MTKNEAITTRFLRRAATWFLILLIFFSSAPPCCAFFQRGPPLFEGCFRPRARIETSRNRAIATTCTASSDGAVVEEAWEGMMFGPHRVDGDQIFYKSDSGKTAAFVNLRPIVPGHVLVVPTRQVSRMHDLTPEELSELWQTAALIAPKIQDHYGASSVNYAVQDGPEAGQSVAHVHVHILPRKTADFANNDDIYDELERHNAFGSEGERTFGGAGGDRKDRTKQEMAAESMQIRQVLGRE